MMFKKALATIAPFLLFSLTIIPNIYATNSFLDNHYSNEIKNNNFYDSSLLFLYQHDVGINNIISPESILAQPQTPEIEVENLGQKNETNVDINLQIHKLDTILSEDFSEGVPPPGWQTTHSTNWLSSNTNYAGGIAPEAMFSWTPSSVDTFRLYTEPIDTTGYTDVVLTFKEHINDYNSLYDIYVEISTDGTNWTSVYHRPGGSYGPATTIVPLNVSQGMGSTTFQLSFTFVGDSYNINFWYIDDVKILNPGSIIEYDETVTIDILSGEIQFVLFPLWIPVDIISTDVDYIVNAYIFLDSDENPDNDNFTKYITLNYLHDVGTKEILEPSYPTDRDMWDLLAEIDITTASGSGGNAGAEFDGNYFYSTRWESNLIHQYDLNGHLVKEFTIPGVSGLRDLAYNDASGYFYGGAAGGTIWEMDFESETLINTITGSFESRAIAYNPDDDVIYCSNWEDPVWIVDPASGAIIDQFNLIDATSTYGFAYDGLLGASQSLWIFDQGSGSGYPQYIFQWDLQANAFTGVCHDVNVDIGSGAGIAGGLFTTADYVRWSWCVGGLYQDSDSPGVADWIFVYELYYHGHNPQEYLTPGNYPVKATVENYGAFTETFNANAKCYFEEPEKEDILVYEDNVTVVDLDISGIAIVDFENITFSDEVEWEGTYRFEITTELPGDEVAENDMKTKTIIMHDHDTEPPVTTAYLIGTMGDNDWYVSDVTITLTAVDMPELGYATGVNNTYYILDGGDLKIYEAPIVVFDDGYHTLEYYSDDYAGNIEDIQYVDFNIDQIPPHIDVEKTVIGAQKIQYDVFLEDETSGAWKVVFYVDEVETYIDDEEPFTWIYEGDLNKIIGIIGYDNAGNSVIWTTLGWSYGYRGIICNPQFNNDNISFYAIIVRAWQSQGDNWWIIFNDFTIPNDYDEGRVGLFLINVKWNI